MPSSDWKEIIANDEPARFARYGEEFRAMQQRRAQRAGRTWRALHAKSLTGLEAEFTVLPDLPSYARVGLFAAPGTYRAYVRYSNGSAIPQADRKPDVRGLAVKIVGVRGRSVVDGRTGIQAQDFLMNRGATTPFRDADEFVGFIRAAEKPLWLIPKLIMHFGFRGGLRVLGQLLKALKEPVLPLAQTAFHSELAIKFGAHAVRYAVTPAATAAPAARTPAQPDYLGDELAAQLRQGAVHYDFRIQFFRDEATTPIENGAVEWLEKDAPFLTVARLTLTPQDTQSPRGRRVAGFVESLSFTPWNAAEEFRPLGSMMRVRHAVYRASSLGRNGAQEPDGTERFE